MSGSARGELVGLYQAGGSIPDVSLATGVPMSTVRYHLKKAGVLRSRVDGIMLARPKLGSGMRGRNRVFSASHKAAISRGKRAHGEATAKGTTIKPSGYIEYTRGEHKGRSEHVVLMETRLGRRLKPDEIVHHIDGVRSNNHPDNLALMTRAAHTRLHRREESIARKAAS